MPSVFDRRDPQLDLFGPRPTAAPAQPHALARVGAALPAHVRFGTSSWTFPAWAGLVYHQHYPNAKVFARDSLREYAAHPLFRTVGIDRSYYAPIPAGELRAYAAQLPADFRCVMKVWSEVTAPVFPDHPRYGERAGQANPGFLDPLLFRDHVLAPVEEAFAAHLGAFVVEVPPTSSALAPRQFEDAVARFLAAASPEFRYSFEIRDRRLLTPRYLAILAEHGATHVLGYHARMPPLRVQRRHPGAIPGPFLVFRLMQAPHTRYEQLRGAFEPFDRLVAPQDAMREDVLEILEEATARDLETYVVVGNKAEGCSPLTVRALAEALVTRRAR